LGHTSVTNTCIRRWSALYQKAVLLINSLFCVCCHCEAQVMFVNLS